MFQSNALSRLNPGSRHHEVLARNELLLLLTLSSGAVDATCYLGLGKVFTAFMTGNLVFLGLRIAGAPGPHLLSVIVAIAAFAGGVHVATRFLKPTRRTNVWPRRVTAVLGLSVISHVAFAALWITVGGHPALTSATFLLGISGLAMGLQTAAVFSLGLQGVFTTAATATVTVLSGDTAHWANTQPERRRLAALLIALVAGATAGGLLVVNARVLAPLLPLTATAMVVAIAAWRFSKAGHEEPADDATADGATESTLDLQLAR